MQRSRLHLKTILQNIQEIIKKYSHAWVFLYALIYFPWFSWLEKNVTSGYSLISSPLDNHIPFVEFFIVPYLLWFGYMAITCMYFFFTCKEEFYKFSKMCIIGMTLFLIICTIFPNGHRLRPVFFARDNYFVDLVRFIYRVDTPTNVLPSLHVYNSVACHIAVMHNDKLSQNKVISYGSLILSLSIVLSTMFLKQHSVIDVISAMIMICFVYSFVYTPSKQKHPALAHQTI